MIKNTDLKVGNELCYRVPADNHESPWKQKTIDWQDIKWCSEDEKGFNDMHIGILITEHLLVNELNFKERIQAGILYQKSLSEEIDVRISLRQKENGDWQMALINCWSINEFYIDVEFLHQLQNYVSAYTKQEIAVVELKDTGIMNRYKNKMSSAEYKSIVEVPVRDISESIAEKLSKRYPLQEIDIRNLARVIFDYTKDERALELRVKNVIESMISKGISLNQALKDFYGIKLTQLNHEQEM